MSAVFETWQIQDHLCSAAAWACVRSNSLASLCQWWKALNLEDSNSRSCTAGVQSTLLSAVASVLVRVLMAAKMASRWPKTPICRSSWESQGNLDSFLKASTWLERNSPPVYQRGIDIKVEHVSYQGDTLRLEALRPGSRPPVIL